MDTASASYAVTLNYLSSLPDDNETLLRARQGEGEALEHLYVTYRRIVFLVAIQIVGNREEALDILQETFLKYFTSIGKIDPERPVKPYLLRITRNIAIDHLRRRKTRPNSPFLEDEKGNTVEPADPAPTQEETLLVGERERLLWHAVQSLDPLHREIIILRDYHDMRYREIAHVLSIPLGTVMSRIHEGRKRLKEMISSKSRTAQSGGHHE